jgi:hypothetical protein
LTVRARNARIRSALGGLVLMAIVGVTLSTPPPLAACQCMGQNSGDVVFTGTVVDSPNELSLLHDVFLANPGVYTFDVESVERGDALDGRVYSGGATCESAYQVGATYRVHASHTSDDHVRGSAPGVSLAIGSCMVGPELLAPQTPLTALPYWALSSQGLPVLSITGFAVLLGIAAYVISRRRSTGMSVGRSG